jgi:hypothetical protein
VGARAGAHVSEKIKLKIKVFRYLTSYESASSYQVSEETAVFVLSNNKNKQGCKSSRSMQERSRRSAE